MALLLAGLLGCGPDSPRFNATDLGQARFGSTWQLANASDPGGPPVQLSDFRGKVVLLFFGYTTCPDVCPSTLARLAALQQGLGPAAAQVQVLFVSLDPARDDPARLASYVPWFHPSFIGLSATPEQLAGLLRAFHLKAERQPVTGGLGYVIDHSTGVFAYGPDGRLRLLIDERLPLPALQADVLRLLAGE